MFVLVTLILLGVVALALIGGAVFSKDYRGWLGGIGAALMVIEFLCFAFGGMQTVGVKEIGVPTAFGTVAGSSMSPGVHFTWQPWMDVTMIDETVQTTTFEGSNCLTVRIGGQQTACADVTIQWQIDPSAADALFQDYSHQGDLMTSIKDAVVVRELKQVVNGTLGDYNPITDVQTVANTNSASQFSKFGPSILTQMRQDIGSRIKVLTVLMPYIHYDNAVEVKLNAIQQSYADFAIATENVNVAHEQSQAYVNLGNPTLNQLVAQCLVEAKTNPNLQCIPGATTNLAITQK